MLKGAEMAVGFGFTSRFCISLMYCYHTSYATQQHLVSKKNDRI
jgi:hypothetical protein